MKKHFVWLLLLFPLLLTGCYGEEDKEKDQGDYIWDFINYNIYFSVKDAAGNNLLDPQVASNILGNEITVEYGDKSFPLENSVDTRFNMPRPLGLRKEVLGEAKERVLSFGEFSPEHQYKGETFPIHWGDGTKDVVKFDLYITWKKQNPTIHKRLYLNDKEYSKDSFLIKIVK